MDASQYQGLLHLSIGSGSFITLLLFLRTISETKSTSTNTVEAEKSDWQHKEQLEILEIISETHDIKTFRLQRLGAKKIPPFKAGQFLSFQIGDDEKQTRSYSISSSNLNPYIIQVSIKKINNGKGSGWFHSKAVGEKIWVYPPTGHFTDTNLRPEVPRYYIAGGIGITPLLSMLLSNLEHGYKMPMILFYGIRASKDLAFHQLLSYLSKRHENFRYFPVMTTNEQGWQGDVGYINEKLIREKIGTISPQSHFFICGPSAMTDKLINELSSCGFNDEQIHNEVFASPVFFDPEKIPVREANIFFNTKKYKYKGKQTILEYLESQGEVIPFACRAGVCGTCKCKVKGKTYVITDSGLTASDKKQGLVLTCVAFPEEDIEIQASL